VTAANRFPPSSRYAGVEIAERADASGAKIPYLLRRFVPPSAVFDVVEVHRVRQGERLDLIAAHYFGDPLLSWRICDANDAIRPDELTETTGRELRITLPAGVPGVRNA
jgi:hypothetical protein